MDEMRIVELLDENGDPVEFEIVADFKVNDQEYAVLRPLDEEEDAVLFRVVDVDGEPTFEVVVDDDEFEMAAEVYEELMSE